jgi:hypothetical protein
VLINIIQGGVASSSSASKSALPFSSAGPRTSSFASTMQSAQTPIAATSEPQAGAVAGQEKPATKKAADSSTKGKAGQPVSAGVPATAPVVSHAASSLLVAASLASASTVPPASAASIVTSSSMALPISSKPEVAASPATELSWQGTSAGLAGKFQVQLTGTFSTTISDPIASRLELDTGKPSEPGAPSLAALTVDVERVGTSVTDQDTAGKGTAAASFANQTSATTRGSNVTVANTSAQESSASVAKLGEAIASSQFSPTLPIGVLPVAMTSESSDISVSAVKQAATDTYLQVNDSHQQSGAAAVASAEIAAGTTNATVSNDIGGAPASQTVPFMPPGAPDPANCPTSVAASSSQLDTPAQLISTSVATNIAETAASLAVSNPGITVKGSQPLATTAETMIRGRDHSPADAGVREIFSTRISLSQAASKTNSSPGPVNQAPFNQAPSSQSPSGPGPLPSNQESARKPADLLPRFSDINPQPLLANAAVASGSVTVGSQPGASPITGVLTQASAAGSQEPGNGTASLPSVNSQPLAASSSTSSPQSGGPVEAARLVTSVSQSEMHIGLRTQAFGSVEVHTRVRDRQVGLSVGSEKGDLRSYLTNEVSGLQTSFRQQDLRFDSIRFLESSGGASAGFSGGANSQSQSSSQQQSSASGFFSIHGPPEDAVVPEVGPTSESRLNVHA